MDWVFLQRDFVPVAVFNNVAGDDARILKKWGEPTWNNPVVRFIDADEHELAPRRDHTGWREGVHRSMDAALKAWRAR